MSPEKEESKKTQAPIIKHLLVPEHRLISEDEKKALLAKYAITQVQLPKINIKDPAIKAIKTKQGDVIEITRKSTTAGESKYYRVVINE